MARAADRRTRNTARLLVGLLALGSAACASPGTLLKTVTKVVEKVGDGASTRTRTSEDRKKKIRGKSEDKPTDLGTLGQGNVRTTLSDELKAAEEMDRDATYEQSDECVEYPECKRPGEGLGTVDGDG